MRSSEKRATGRLATRTLTDIVGNVRDTHKAVAKRVFGWGPRVTLPVKVIHNPIAAIVYGSIRGGEFALGFTAAEAFAATKDSGVPLGSTLRGNFALSAVNGTLGDELDEQGNPLSIKMAVRRDRVNVGLRPADLAAAFPAATPKLAVFMHGLGGSEDAWHLRSGRRDGESHGSLLASEHGYTPVEVRYNSGLHVAENGRQLAALLDVVVAAWPTEVDAIILLGHSMGGLVIRSACDQADENGWVSTVHHVFYLGTPHTGAPLERGVSRLIERLVKVEEGRPLATFLDKRSVGIKDLHSGSYAPLLDSTKHYAVSASVTADPDHPVALLVGDLLVLPASAHGKGHLDFPEHHKHHVGRLTHFGLLNNPAVYDAMSEWLTLKGDHSSSDSTRRNERAPEPAIS